MGASGNKTELPQPPAFETTYPSITRWVKDLGNVEFGYDRDTDTFVRATDESGVRFGGGDRFGTIDDALRALERGIKENLMGQTKSKSARESGNSKDRDTRRSPDRRPSRPPESPQARKVRSLEEMADELRQGKDFPVTRLTSLKRLCDDPKAAGAFALFLARKAQKAMREKATPERYRQLVGRAVREMKLYLEQPTEERERTLWSLWHEMREEQNEHRPIAWGTLRIIKDMHLLVAEKCLDAVLRPGEASYWLYQAARNYAERYDSRYPNGLTRKSAPMVAEIAGFWRKQLGPKRRGSEKR